MKRNPGLKTRLCCVCGLLLVCLLVAGGCHTARYATHERTGSRLISEYSRGWLRYQVYLEDAGQDAKGQKNVLLNIRVINLMDNTSPLRKRCANLDEYNVAYEYLLNQCRNELYLSNKGAIAYPVSYSFENNYNAFPFESINVGYAVSPKRHSYQLVYADRVFLQDTVRFSISF